jgi:branched-chain amino acid aminotransferase
VSFPRTEWIWKNGELIPWEDATIHSLSHVVHHGSCVFEGVRCYETAEGAAIFRLRDHMRRLVGSAKVYRMELAHSAEELGAACVELVRSNGLRACYIRPFALRGLGYPGVNPTGTPIEVFIACWPWGTYLGDEALERGVDACVSSWSRPAPNTLPVGAKAAGNYLSSQLIKMEALANGYDEGIALSPGGLVSEGSAQNLFLVRDGALFTPAVDGTLLAGITRHTVLQIIKDLDLTVVQGPIPREDLYTADELFFCGTAVEVTPVRAVDGVPIGSREPGPITRRIQSRFLESVTGRLGDVHGWLTRVE